LQSENPILIQQNIYIECAEGTTQGCITAYSITILFYIMRKECLEQNRRRILLKLCELFTVEDINLCHPLLKGINKQAATVTWQILGNWQEGVCYGFTAGADLYY